jgi:hypothetical protein
VIAAIVLLMPCQAGGQEPFDGWTMVSPLQSSATYALDMDGTVVNTWQGSASPASCAYLLADGSVVRPCEDTGGSFNGGGLGGRLQKIDADNNIVWDYLLSTYDYQQHHDVQPMPNGNVLAIAWERKTRQEAIDAGRQTINGEMWPTMIAEIQPDGATGGNVVWEWHLWDHLVQDADPGKPNYGVVADHPELIDINYGTVGPQGGDWIHANSVDYNEYLDQILFSSRAFDEFYIIDHSTTTAEAAGHAGDILYRWGNPAVYDRGGSADQHFYVIHGVNWIDCGLPGAGNILAFNNGDRVGPNDYSSVDEIAPPLNADGTYDITEGEAFGPWSPVWSYSSTGWYAGQTQCSCYRLPNGNTIICAAQSGYMFEITEAGQTVWDYDYPANVPRGLRYWTIDFDDFERFAACITGPGQGAADCEASDTDCDDDVDVKDFAALQVACGILVGP